jgi:hypothetical protein
MLVFLLGYCVNCCFFIFDETHRYKINTSIYVCVQLTHGIIIAQSRRNSYRATLKITCINGKIIVTINSFRRRRPYEERRTRHFIQRLQAYASRDLLDTGGGSKGSIANRTWYGGVY